MEVILTQHLKKLGSIGDVVKVKNGYARNYLLPQDKALRATKENVAYFEAKRAEIEKRNADAKKEAEKTAKGLEGAVVVIIRQASDDGRLYGSVSARDIADALIAKKHEVSRNQVDLNLVIKEIGVYPVKVELHPEVVVSVKANVARSESEAAEALKAPKAKKEGEAKAKSITEEVLEKVEAEEGAEEVAAEADVAEVEAKNKDESAA